MSTGLNDKKLPVGSVGYFVERSNQPPYDYYVHYGIIEEHYATEIAMKLYELKDVRIIDGVPIKEFKTPTRWMKLPKGWTYNTKLFTIEYGEYEYPPRDYNITKPEDILQAIADGVLVKVEDNDHAQIEAEIDSKNGYRIVRKYPPYHWDRTDIWLRYDKVYATYDEAKAVVDSIEAEFKRQSELSDYDWSLEQIDRTINRCVGMYLITKEQGEEFRQRLIDMGNIEEIETRIFGGGLQWKYWKAAKWKTMA